MDERLESLQGILGHTDINTRMIHAHLVPDYQESVFMFGLLEKSGCLVDAVTAEFTEKTA